MRFSLTLSLLGVALLLAPAAGGAQLVLDSDPGRAVRTRADLQRLITEYEAALTSPAYSESVKRSIRQDAARIRDRLENGDFRVGDRITVMVTGEPNYPDTVIVEPGPVVRLRTFGDVPLHGVLRSEIADHLTAALREYVRDPVVRANTLMRLTIMGSIGRPGFYSMPPETTLGDMMMMAGGPGSNADLDAVRIERAGQSLYEEEEMREALRQGLTLDQLNLQAGDQIFVPGQPSRSIWGRGLAIVGSVASVAFLLVRLRIL